MKRFGKVLLGIMCVGILTGCGETKEPMDPAVDNPFVGGFTPVEDEEPVASDEALVDIIPDEYIEGVVTDSPFQYIEESDTMVKEWEEYRPLYNGTHCLECEDTSGSLFIESEAEDCTYGEDGLCVVCGFNPETELIRTVFEKVSDDRHRCIMYQNNAVLYDYEEECFFNVDGVCILCQQ